MSEENKGCPKDLIPVNRIVKKQLPSTQVRCEEKWFDHLKDSKAEI